MGAKVSAQMMVARHLIEQGVTPHKAAKLAGVTPSAIYMSKWWKSHDSKKLTRSLRAKG